MAPVRFHVTRDLDLPAQAVFDALVDWPGHAAWVPLTRVVVESGAGGPGTVFVARTGVGPLCLPDRMRVTRLDRDSMQVQVEKVGPILTGVVNIRVHATGGGCRLDWVEDITVPGLPRFLCGVVAAAASTGFSVSISTLARILARSRPRG